MRLWLPFTNAENKVLKFSNSWNLWKFREISSVGQLNVTKNSGVLKTGLDQDAWEVWGLKPLSKQYGSGFAEIRSGKRRPCAEHNRPIKPCLIRDDLHKRAHLHSNGHLLTPALKEIRRTRAERLLQWHSENGHENFLFTDEKFFATEQYNNQNNNIYAPTPLEVHSEDAGMPSPFLRHGLLESVPSGGDISLFSHERGETSVQVYQEDMLQGTVKQFNMTLYSGQEWVFQHDSVPAQNPRRIRSGCGGLFRPLWASRIGPRGVQTSTPGTINCGLFWWTWLAKCGTTTWSVWRDPSRNQRQRSPWRRCVPR